MMKILAIEIYQLRFVFIKQILCYKKIKITVNKPVV